MPSGSWGCRGRKMRSDRYCASFGRIASGLLLACLLVPQQSGLASAADAAKAPGRDNWTGFYIGGHFGYGTGTLGPGTNPTQGQAWPLPPSATGYIGGFQAGLNVEVHNRIVLGIESDVTFG